jgi:hypothetical protein
MTMSRRLAVTVKRIIPACGLVFLIGSIVCRPSEAQVADAFDLLKSITIDGGSNLGDEARGVAVDSSGSIFLAGYITVPGQGKDIYLARYDSDLVLQDSETVNGDANGDDEGYVMAFDGAGFLYLVGYMTEANQGHNAWIGKFDADLKLVKDATVAGSEGGDDDAYGLLFDEVSGNLYVAGTLRETGEGANIWLAIYDTDLDLVDQITRNGPVGWDTDKARFMTFDDTRHLFVSGSMTQAVTDYDIWIGKFEDDLDFVDEVIVAGPTTDEDKGYGIVFDGDDTIFVTGTMIETDESYNIWMAKYDTNLNPLGSVTINGPVDGEDVAYLMTIDDDGHLYHAGTYTETLGGTNIWLARFDSTLTLESWTTVDGPASGWDTGIGIALGADDDLYVSGIVNATDTGLDLWLGRFDDPLIFTASFEIGSTSRWSNTTP